MRTHRPGRHELGQNFLIDQSVVNTLVSLVADTNGPIVEIGTGDGALTLPLQQLGREITGIEIDDRRAARLARHVQAPTRIVRADFLEYPLPSTPHVLVGNLPFHQTTAMLRRVLRAPGWTDAVLLVQWEVARRRAGVGGATLMTAQWWPWCVFGLEARVPSAAFRPRPGVDGGVLTITRRERALVDAPDRVRYQEFVRRVFSGRGRGLAEIVAGAGVPLHEVRSWMRQHRLAESVLPKRLTAERWAELYRLLPPRAAARPAPPPRRPGRRRGERR